MSKNNQHTPGPWVLDTYGNLKVGTDYVRFSGLCLSSGREANANTRLIAAAPDLLAAIKRLIASNEAHATMHADDGDDIARMIGHVLAFENAKKVLAKATGEPQ